MWPFKPKHKHRWKTIKPIIFAGEIGCWLIECVDCGKHGVEKTDGALVSCIKQCPVRGTEYRFWLEGQNPTREISKGE